MSASPIPVVILTGFLGSGKTTVLNHLLHSDHGLRLAVLVNDFGAVNIDAALVTGVEGETISLSNGCICCSIRGDLLEAVAGLLRRPERPQAIVIETSGVSQPAAVASTFLQPELERYLTLSTIAAVVDAEQGGRALEGEQFFLAMDQVGVADLVLLNKVDLVDAARLADMRRWIREIAPNARIIETRFGVVPPEIMLDAGRLALPLPAVAPVHVHAPGEAEHAHEAHTRLFSTWHWTSSEALSMRALRRAVERLPSHIYRAKGIVYLEDLPEERGILQVVGRRASLGFGEPWGSSTPGSQIVVIGSQALDPAALQAHFDAALARNAPQGGLGWMAQAVTDWLRGPADNEKPAGEAGV